VAEEHQRNGGLGESIANLLAHKLPVPVEFVAVNDSFGESGKPLELLEKYGLSSNDVANAARRVLERKKV
jgi:transketolase